MLPLLPSTPWPTGARAASVAESQRLRVQSRRVGLQRLVTFRPVDYGRRTATDRGLYRIFNSAVYRFYRRSDGQVPQPGVDSPYATSASLPATPAVTFSDGTWLIVTTYFNGVIESDPLPDSNGQPYARLEISSAAVVLNPPLAPSEIVLTQKSGGVVNVRAVYDQDDTDGLRADDFVISATYDGSTPGEDPSSPAAEVEIAAEGFAVLDYDLPAQSHGTTVKVRVQTRRDGPYWSNDSSVSTTTADAQGPAAPPGGVAWRGSLPEAT